MMIPSSSRGEVSWTNLQLLQGSTLVQLSLCLQDLVHVLCELCIEALGDLARLADYDVQVRFSSRRHLADPSVNRWYIVDSLPLLSMIT